MSTRFQVNATSAFERQTRKITKKNRPLALIIERMIDILEEDPYNLTRKYDIKKLEGVKGGEGRWRIRSGDYRLRYDIFSSEVVLHSFSHRKEAY